MLYGEKFGFYKRCSYEKQYEGIIFCDFALPHLSKQVEDGDFEVKLEVELECDTPIKLGHEDVVSNLI